MYIKSDEKFIWIDSNSIIAHLWNYENTPELFSDVYSFCGQYRYVGSGELKEAKENKLCKICEVACKNYFIKMDRYYNIKRYCFHCKKVTKFLRCDNCNKYFCLDHAEYDEERDDMGYFLFSYPLHLIKGEPC